MEEKSWTVWMKSFQWGVQVFDNSNYYNNYIEKHICYKSFHKHS